MTDTTFNPASLSPTKLSRRAFLAGLGVIAAGSAFFVVPQGQLLAPNATQEELIANLQRAMFARFINDSFALMLGSARATLTLLSVSDLAAPITFATEEQNRAYQEMSFSIVFSGPSQQPLAQGNYTVEHRYIGTFPLFIVPMQPVQGVMYYEATFNRLPV